MNSGAGARALIAAVVASVALLGTYLALGGASYQPIEVADPCDPRPIEPVEGLDETLEQLALSALDGAACSLRVTREDLALALANPETRTEFLNERHISDERLEAAVRSAAQRAIDEADRIDAISGLQAVLLREAVDAAPVGAVIDVLQSAPAQDALDFLGDQLFE